MKTVETLENLWIGTLERAVRSPLLLRAHGGGLGLGLAARDLAEAWTQRVAAFWGLPTAAQMRETLTMLQQMDERLAEMETRLSERETGA